jgi:ABC transporter transmembrane region
MPCCSCSLGKILDGFNGAPAELAASVEGFCLVYVIVGAISLVSSFCYTLCWTVSGERQTLRLQETYVSAVLRQVRILTHLLCSA